MFKAKPDRCMYSGCWNGATHKHQNLKCFGFCDDHWPPFIRLMTHGLRPTEEQKDEALALSEDGMSPGLIAKRLRLPVAVVRGWVHVPAERTPITDGEIAEAIAMRQQGYTWDECADQLGRAPQTLKAKLRGLPEAKKLSKYATFFCRVRQAEGLVRFPFDVANPTTTAANINKGRYVTAPKGEFRARTVDGVVWVEAVRL